MGDDNKLESLASILGGDEAQLEEDVKVTLEALHARLNKGKREGDIFDMQDVIMGCMQELNAQIRERDDEAEESEEADDGS